MAKTERIRQEVPASMGAEGIIRHLEQGWKLVAVEWEREVPDEDASSAAPEASEQPRGFATNEVPFGLHITGDPPPPHLQEDNNEREILFLMMELTIQDGPYSVIAEELNRRGYRTRMGTKWTPVSVFQMLPRLIEVGPKIFATKEWQERRARIAGGIR